MSCNFHKISYDPFWKETNGVCWDDLETGDYNCLDCGITVTPFHDFTVIKISKSRRKRTKLTTLLKRRARRIDKK